MGKGSKPRPFTDRKTFESNWDAIFNKKKPEQNQQDTSKPEEEDDHARRKAKQIQSGDS